MGKLNEYLKEILVKCTMCKPEEVHDLYTSMAQEYMNRGGVQFPFLSFGSLH